MSKKPTMRRCSVVAIMAVLASCMLAGCIQQAGASSADHEQAAAADRAEPGACVIKTSSGTADLSDAELNQLSLCAPVSASATDSATPQAKPECRPVCMCWPDGCLCYYDCT